MSRIGKTIRVIPDEPKRERRGLPQSPDQWQPAERVLVPIEKPIKVRSNR